MKLVNVFVISLILSLIGISEAENFNNKGLKLLKEGRLKDAISNFDLAIKLHPKNPRSFNNKGVVLCLLRRYYTALENFNQAIMIDPFHSQAWLNRARVLKKLNLHKNYFKF